MDNRAYVTTIVEGEANGFFKLAITFFTSLVQRSLDSDYQDLESVRTREMAPNLTTHSYTPASTGKSHLTIATLR